MVVLTLAARYLQLRDQRLAARGKAGANPDGPRRADDEDVAEEMGSARREEGRVAEGRMSSDEVEEEKV